jgi:hypothetical protein
LTQFNSGKSYADQIKPFNFLLTCHVMPFGHPLGADPEHFRLIAPYQPEPGQWTKMEWIDQYSKSGKRKTKNAGCALGADCEEASPRPCFRSKTEHMETDSWLGNGIGVVLLVAIGGINAPASPLARR